MGELARPEERWGEAARDLGKRINRSQRFPPVRENGSTRHRIEGGAYFQLYLSDADPGMFFGCMGPEPGKSPSCRRTEELAPELIVALVYSYNYRPTTGSKRPKSARIRRLLLDNMRVAGTQ